MNPIYKALLASAVVCIALYFLFDEFLGGTESLNESLDVKSLAHTRENDSQAKPVDKPVLVAESPVPEDDAPEREEDTVRIDAATVLPVSGDAEAADKAEGAEEAAEAGAVKADEDDAEKEGTEEEGADEDADADSEEEDASEDAEDAQDEQSETISGEARLKQVLGIDEPEPPVRAVDVSYQLPENCDAGAVVLAPVAVQYRFESPSITGTGLRELELLMAEYRRCDGGEFRFAHNPLGNQDATPQLKQMRLDELKYFFLQHRVPKTALTFPDDS